MAFETMHCIDQKRKGKKGLMAIKLNMSKAYNRVEWAFLEAITKRLAFQERWIRLIMMCVSRVSYSMLIIGETKCNIIPTRGLCQGDLISPTFFCYVLKVYLPCYEKRRRKG